MTMQRILKLVILAFPFSFPVYADRNLAGDEIIVLSEPIRDSSIDTSLQFSSRLQNDPVLNYVPELASGQPGHSAAELAQVSTDNLWQRIRNGYAMPEVDSPYTATHEAWYAARPDYVRRMVERSQRYLYHVVVEVEKRGMPTEIALLPMVESAFNPQAYSKSHASGIWQFIPSTGKNFGLKQDWWVDSRRDVTAATDAALTYLQKLHLMFGTWDLALAAYNAGEGTVSRAIARNRQQGLPTDYNSLPLPPETRNYVPKLQAVKNIMTNPELYGLNIQSIPNRPYFTKVTAPQQIDAHLAAKLAEISFEEFSSLNPEYNRPVLTASGSAHEILLPIGAAETFKTNLEAYDKPLVSWQTYHAKRGERMANIARKFGIPLAELRNVNDLPSRDNLIMARPLLVPMDNGGKADANIVLAEHVDVAEPAIAKAEPTQIIRHKVSGNDTLLSIAKRYKLSTQQLMAQNQLKSSKLKPGQILNVASGPASINKTVVASSANRKAEISKTKLVSSKKKQRYIVQRGDTLESIARKFDVARDELQRWNKISGSRIVPGAILTIAKPDQA